MELKATRRLLIAATALFAVLAAALVAVADPREIHERGVEAVEQQRWEDAVRFFTAAIAERAEERAPLIGRKYLPHFYLGVALAETGDCTAALEAWAESERQAKIQKAEELAATLPERKNVCREHLRQVELAKSAVEDVLGQAESTAPTLESLSQRQALAPVWSNGASSYGARADAARQRLASARQRLAEGSEASDLEILGEARDMASQAVGELRAVIADARRQLGELNAAADSALAELGAVEATAMEAVRSVFDLQPYPSGLASRVADVQRALQRIEERRDAALAPELEELGVTLQAAVDELESAATRPPRTLWSSVEAFLAGDYERVLELLGDGPYSRGRSARHACHLETASRYALYVLGGESQPELLDLARQGALACHEMAPSFQISRRYFSPRYVEFYDETVNPPGGDETTEAEMTSEGTSEEDASTQAEPADS